MSKTHQTSAEIRAKLGHPVIDGDGHIVEYGPTYKDYLKEVAGPRIVQRFETVMSQHVGPYWFNLGTEQRRDIGVPRGPWWGRSTRNTLDSATALLPNLLRRRLDSFGIDFSVVYPTLGLQIIREEDDEMRRATCRALNVMLADLFAEHAERMTPAATIPMYSPQEAIAEAEYAVQELGLKACMVSGYARRPVPIVARQAPDLAPYTFLLDNIALDSEHDYDPFWAKCLELKVAPTAHSAGMGWGSRTSPSNYVFNHIGMFAAAHESFAKALVMGGVTCRFPKLKFGFLEAGVGWAVNTLSDMVGHWEKRNGRAIHNYNPAHIDVDETVRLFLAHGGRAIRQPEAALRAGLERIKATARDAGDTLRPDEIDDFARAKVTSAEELVARFAPNFYFGCEADDPLVATAFDRRLVPGGGKLKAMFSSDISHWDVVDMEEVLEEAYELVEHGHLDLAEFRDFTFGHIAELHAGMNPAFFDGTVVAEDVRKQLAAAPRTAAAE
jgi:predicted TIM-barrel fold metal-dependent hydrolase